MHIFYFLTPEENFELLKNICLNWKEPVGISFRRFTPSGFSSGFKQCFWDENLTQKYIDGGYSELYLTTNNSLPEHETDWNFLDREKDDLIVIEGGRTKGNELEHFYLRCFSKKTNCTPLYKKIRRTMKAKLNQGLYAGKHFYKDIFYSDPAYNFRLVSKFDSEYNYRKEKP